MTNEIKSGIIKLKLRRGGGQQTTKGGDGNEKQIKSNEIRRRKHKKGGEMKTNEKTHINTTKEGEEETTMQKNTPIQEILPEGGNGMKGTIDQLIETGHELNEKQAQARKSYDELMKGLNERLKGIHIEGPTLRYTVHEWVERGYVGILRRHKARLALHFWEEGAYLELEERWEGEDQWHTDTLVHPSLETMWAVSENLEDALDYFLEKVQQRSPDYGQAIAVLTDLIAKLR